MKDLSKKINSAVWIVLISNLLGGVGFIIAYFITKEILLLLGGIFVMIAAVGFKLVMQRIIDKLSLLENQRK